MKMFSERYLNSFIRLGIATEGERDREMEMKIFGTERLEIGSKSRILINVIFMLSILHIYIFAKCKHQIVFTYWRIEACA